MPLTGDAKKVMASMVEQYGPEKGKQVFYATANKQKREERTWKKKSCFVAGKLACRLSETPEGKRALESGKKRDPEGYERNYQAGLKVEKEHGEENARVTTLDHMAENIYYYDEFGRVKEKLEGKSAALAPPGQFKFIPGYTLREQMDLISSSPFIRRRLTVPTPTPATQGTTPFVPGQVKAPKTLEEKRQKTEPYTKGPVK